MRSVAMVLGTMLALGFPSATFAHGGVVDVTPATLWSHWEWHPPVVIGMVLGWGIYERGLSHHGVRSHRGQVAAFMLGMGALAIALLSPISALSGALFTAHMVQHLILVAIAAPLIAISRPLVPLLWGLPGVARRGVAWGVRRKGLRVIGRWLTHPLVAFALHLGMVWLWHIPAFYDGAVAQGWLHDLEHLSFLGSALLYWWVVTQPRHYGTAVLSLFGMAMGSAALGLLMTLTRSAWYTSHIPYVAQWGFTPLSDQQVAGLIMWIPAGIVYLVAAVVLLATWIMRIEAQVNERDQHRKVMADA